MLSEPCSHDVEEEQFRLLREAYLPETILAYVHTLRFAGSILSRDLLMECMDLSALIAEEGSDLLDIFIKTGRAQELVEAFAHAGKTLLVTTSIKGSTGARSKKLRAKGWTPDIWSVRS
jgi:nuclear pore complex protein Nup107